MAACERPIKRRSHLERFFIEEHVYIFFDAVNPTSAIMADTFFDENEISTINIWATLGSVSANNPFCERIELIPIQA